MFNQDETTPNETEPKDSSGMKKLVAIFTVILIVAVGVRFYFARRAHLGLNQTAPAEAEGPSYTKDQLVLPRRLHQTDLKDASELDGKRVWVFAAGQLNAYPATKTQINYAKPGPLLLGAEPLDVVGFIEQKAPVGTYSRVPKGDRQVVMLFRRAAEPDKLVGTPVGFKEGKFYTFYLDECFFYDDPHILYAHWLPEQWKAVDEHRAIKGMSEMQAQLALGQVSKPGAGSPGDRTVVYDNDGKPVTITFVKDKATSIS